MFAWSYVDMKGVPRSSDRHYFDEKERKKERKKERYINVF